MIISKFAPKSNLILVKHVYEVKAMALSSSNKQTPEFERTLDKTVVAIGPEVTNCKVGDIVCMNPRPYLSEPIDFEDNYFDIQRVAKRLQKEMAAIPFEQRSAYASKILIIHGYMVMMANDIFAEVCSVEDPDHIKAYNDRKIDESGVILSVPEKKKKFN